MTQPHDQPYDPAPDPTPEQEARLRGLLADLGSGPDGEPLPPEVAARLDATLARLVAERSAETDDTGATGVVVPLRRGWWPRVGAAAAAVVLLGTGGVAVARFGLGNSSAGNQDAGASSSAADSSAPLSEQRSPQPSEDAGGATTLVSPTEQSAPEATSGARTRREVVASLPEVGSASFAQDAGALVGDPSGRSPGLASTRPTPTPEPDVGGGRMITDEVRAAGCRPPSTSDDAEARAIRYDGAPAVLVVHPPQAGRQLVEAWDCSGERRLARTRLAATDASPRD